MIYPTLDQFKKLSSEYGRITVYREMAGDLDTPVSLLSKLLPFERVILLESAKQNKTYSRFSFLAFDLPEKLTLRADGLYRNGELFGPASYLQHGFGRNATPQQADLGDFSGGFVGYLNYDFVSACGILRRPLGTRPDVLGVFYLVEKFCVYDNYANKLYVAVSRRVPPSNVEGVYREIDLELEKAAQELAALAMSHPARSTPVVTRVIPREHYMDGVAKARQMIEDGEAIQIVLSDYMEAEEVDPFDFYRNLRRINPSPYMYFIKDGQTCIVGSSPEIHLRIRDRVATLKPIAGTRRREDASEDLSKTVELLVNDEKERAEHLMLVDLARNDLSRICKVGSVKVETFMDPEIYSHVVHLVTEVNGELRDEVDLLEALRYTFPAGTVSGAPKVRAMEIIDDLEKEPRGAYAGCLGYIGFNGNVDMAITIRTAIFEARKARLQAGAGIVYDSVPAREYEEVMNKLRALMTSGGLA